MIIYIIKRIFLLIPLIFLISLLSFIVIQLPPGDYVDDWEYNMRAAGYIPSPEEILQMKQRYNLDKGLFQQYLKWITNILLEGDFGVSFTYYKPVSEILYERVPRTIAISLAAILVQWVIALPIGIYSAVRKYSASDYIFTFIGFIGISIPGFMFALVLVYLVYINTGYAITGLYSEAYRYAPWDIDKFIDLLKNVSIPLIVLGTSGAAVMIRILRSSMLDELERQYVTTARSKGLSEIKLLFKYPFRIAINPLISTIGWLLPAVVGGEVVISKVLNMPTTGPVLLKALMGEDMYLAGGILFLLSSLTVIGTLISDILLALLDPRIRYQ
ncbi:MAG: ABC transporter permease [Bacteroidetes bacterium]|nr:ABC transporter permease [Bacteroidota bacterium]